MANIFLILESFFLSSLDCVVIKSRDGTGRGRHYSQHIPAGLLRRSVSPAMMEDAGYWIGGEVGGEVGSLDDRRRSQLRHAKVSETKYRGHLLVYLAIYDITNIEKP